LGPYVYVLLNISADGEVKIKYFFYCTFVTCN